MNTRRLLREFEFSIVVSRLSLTSRQTVKHNMQRIRRAWQLEYIAPWEWLIG